MSTKTVYLFDAVTGELVGLPYPAQASPLEPGKYIEPACSTPIEPPAPVAGKVAVFANGAWSMQLDFRNATVYDQISGAVVQVTAIGTLPAGLAITPPPLTPVQQWATYQASAKGALLATDTTVARISEAISLGATTATTADVVAFMQYRKDLRAILTQAQPKTIPTALPTKPAYPANT